MNITIRLMEAKDIEQIQHIAKTAWHATYEGIIPQSIQDKFLAVAYNVERLFQRMQQSIVYVAEIEDTVSGFANYSPIDESGTSELAAIYLLPSSQGKGVGTALLQRAIQDFSNLKEIHLTVERDNSIGMNFYVAKGFKIVEEFEEDFEGHVLQSVRMVLEV